jgi:hypothetical protein
MGTKFSKKTVACTFVFASVRMQTECSNVKLFLYVSMTRPGYALEYRNLDRTSS